MKDKTLAIFTPTYNRGYILEKAYKSLIAQTCSDFEWYIIDDGSNDNTESLVKSWQDEDLISIKYYKKNNGGKHTAYNYAVNVIQNELTLLCLDSDEYLTKDAVEIIIDNWKKYKNHVYGFVYLCDDEEKSNKYCIKYDIEKLNDCSLSNALNMDLFNASAVFAVRTDYLKDKVFPVIENEKFFTESYLLMDFNVPFKWTQNRICIREYKDDGLTKNMNKMFSKYPKSWFLYNKKRVENVSKVNKIVKYSIYYIAFGILAKEKNIIKNSKYKILTFMLYPAGMLGSIYIKIKAR